MKFPRKLVLVFLVLAFTGASHAGFLGELLSRPGTAAGVAVIGAAHYASKSCKTVKDEVTGRTMLVCGTPDITKAENAPEADTSPSDAERKTNPSKQDSPVWGDLDNAGNGVKTSGSGSKQRYYEWDHTHNDIEVYDKNGRHLGSMDPTTGELYKPPVNGRRLKQ